MEKQVMDDSVLNREQIRKVYTSKRYDECYYELFEPTLFESGFESESELEEYLEDVMQIFLETLSKGFSKEWSHYYAFFKHYLSDKTEEPCFYDIREILEKSHTPKEDWDLYVKSFDKGEVFEEYMNCAFEKGYGLSFEEFDGRYPVSDYAMRYASLYNKLIESGHSRIYADKYMEAYDYDDDFNLGAEIQGELYDMLAAKEITEEQLDAIQGEVFSIEDNLYSLSDGYVRKYKDKLRDDKLLSLIANIIGRFLVYTEAVSDEFVPIYEKWFKEAMEDEDYSEMWMVRDDALNEYYMSYPGKRPNGWDYYRDSEGLSDEEQLEMLDMQMPKQRRTTLEEDILDMMFPNGDDRDEQIGDFVDKM